MYVELIDLLLIHITHFIIYVFVFVYVCIIYTVAISVDTPERARYCCTTHTGGKTKHGCFRCVGAGWDLIDVEFNAFSNHRSLQHYEKILQQHPNSSKSDFSSKTGYSTMYYKALLLKNVCNASTICTVDSGHDKKNISKQLDTTIKKNHLKNNNVRLFLLLIHQQTKYQTTKNQT